MTRAAGFTLLELLVALALIATLLGAAVPRLSAHLPAARLDHGARHLAGEARLARMKAVASGRRVRLVVDLAAARWTVATDEDGSFVAAGGASLPGGVRFDRERSSRIRDGEISITFQPRGHTADNATIALAAGEDLSRRVIVNIAGRVRIE